VAKETPSAPATPVERSEPSASVVDVLDRVLDGGIALDAWTRVSIAINLVAVETRVVVVSIDTRLSHSEGPPDPPAGER
jgi:hypothetical protein